jgi:UDP-N-acetyl-D-mannosaminuronate dehydrogenase
LSAAATAVEVADDLPTAIMAVNARRYDVIERAVLDASAGAIGIAGVAFKPSVDTVDGSPATELARRWTACGRAVHLFDPLVEQFELPGTRWANSCEELVAKSDVVVLVNGDDDVRRSVRAACVGASAPPIIDVWEWTSR